MTDKKLATNESVQKAIAALDLIPTLEFTLVSGTWFQCNTTDEIYLKIAYGSRCNIKFISNGEVFKTTSSRTRVNIDTETNNISADIKFQSGDNRGEYTTKADWLDLQTHEGTYFMATAFYREGQGFVIENISSVSLSDFEEYAEATDTKIDDLIDQVNDIRNNPKPSVNSITCIPSAVGITSDGTLTADTSGMFTGLYVSLLSNKDMSLSMENVVCAVAGYDNDVSVPFTALSPYDLMVEYADLEAATQAYVTEYSKVPIVCGFDITLSDGSSVNASCAFVNVGDSGLTLQEEFDAMVSDIYLASHFPLLAGVTPTPLFMNLYYNGKPIADWGIRVNSTVGSARKSDTTRVDDITQSIPSNSSRIEYIASSIEALDSSAFYNLSVEARFIGAEKFSGVNPAFKTFHVPIFPVVSTNSGNADSLPPMFVNFDEYGNLKIRANGYSGEDLLTAIASAGIHGDDNAIVKVSSEEGHGELGARLIAESDYVTSGASFAGMEGECLITFEMKTAQEPETYIIGICTLRSV